MRQRLIPFISYTLLSFFCALLALPACKKFVEVDPPSTQIESTKIFTNDETALAAINGLYAMIGLANLTFVNGGITLYAGVSADELYTTASSTDLDPFFANAVPPTHTNLLNRLWRPAYNNNYLYTANAIIEALNRSTTLNDSLKKQLLGEAKVIRAMGYFYLINLFGDVPLVLSTDFEANSQRPRASVAEVYQQIIADLLEGQSLLTSSYPSANRARVNKWTAAALLARVYLYRGNWAAAEAMASSVIGAGVYALNNNLSQVFTVSSNETIWHLVRDNNNTADGATYIPASTNTRPTYAMTPHLMNAFSSGDGRKNAWVGKNTVGAVDYYYPSKYKSRVATQATEYYVLFRLAEQYLIRAEARAQLGNISGAQGDLNVIRTRAGLANTTANDQPSLLDAILAERRIELFAEMGHRWFDLKRTGMIGTVLSTVKPAWQNSRAVLPIPQSEMDKNPFLTQNPGY